MQIIKPFEVIDVAELRTQATACAGFRDRPNRTCPWRHDPARQVGHRQDRSACHRGRLCGYGAALFGHAHDAGVRSDYRG